MQHMQSKMQCNALQCKKVLTQRITKMGEVESKKGQIRHKLAPSWPQLGPSWPDLAASWPKVAPSWRQVDGSWPQVRSSWAQVAPNSSEIGSKLDSSCRKLAPRLYEGQHVKNIQKPNGKH